MRSLLILFSHIRYPIFLHYIVINSRVGKNKTELIKLFVRQGLFNGDCQANNWKFIGIMDMTEENEVMGCCINPLIGEKGLKDIHAKLKLAGSTVILYSIKYAWSCFNLSSHNKSFLIIRLTMLLLLFLLICMEVERS